MPEQRGEGGTARGRRAQPGVGRVGVPARQLPGQVGGIVGAELIGVVDEGLPAAGLPALDGAARDPQDRLFRIRILFTVRRRGETLHDGNACPAHRQRRRVQVVVGVVDDDQQVPQRIGRPARKRRAVNECRAQQRNQFVGVGRQEASRADTVERTGNVDVWQPLQPRPVGALQIAGDQRHPEHRRVVPRHRLSDPGTHRRPRRIGLTQDGDPRDFGQVDPGRHVAHGAVGVEQAA